MSTESQLLNLFPFRSGHFRYESGHHGDQWLDLELFCLHPEKVRPFAIELAGRLAGYHMDFICGPLIEGAFVGLMAATELGVAFSYSERMAPCDDSLYSVGYRIPSALRNRMRGKRVAIVNDVINAGSAVRGTYSDLLICGAQPVVVASLLVTGSSASEFAKDKQIPLEYLASVSSTLWAPDKCPLCASGVRLDEMTKS